MRYICLIIFLFLGVKTHGESQWIPPLEGGGIYLSSLSNSSDPTNDNFNSALAEEIISLINSNNSEASNEALIEEIGEIISSLDSNNSENLALIEEMEEIISSMDSNNSEDSRETLIEEIEEIISSLDTNKPENSREALIEEIGEIISSLDSNSSGNSALQKEETPGENLSDSPLEISINNTSQIPEAIKKDSEEPDRTSLELSAEINENVSFQLIKEYESIKSLFEDDIENSKDNPEVIELKETTRANLVLKTSRFGFPATIVLGKFQHFYSPPKQPGIITDLTNSIIKEAQARGLVLLFKLNSDAKEEPDLNNGENLEFPLDAKEHFISMEEEAQEGKEQISIALLERGKTIETLGDSVFVKGVGYHLDYSKQISEESLVGIGYVRYQNSKGGDKSELLNIHWSHRLNDKTEFWGRWTKTIEELDSSNQKHRLWNLGLTRNIQNKMAVYGIAEILHDSESNKELGALSLGLFFQPFDHKNNLAILGESFYEEEIYSNNEKIDDKGVRFFLQVLF